MAHAPADAPALPIDYAHDGMRSNSGWWWFLALGGVAAAFVGTIYYCTFSQQRSAWSHPAPENPAMVQPATR